MNYINSTLWMIGLEFWKRAILPTLHDCENGRDDDRDHGHDDDLRGDGGRHRHDRAALHWP